MMIGIFKKWLVKYFFVHKIVLKAILVFEYTLDYLATFAVSKMVSYVSDFPKLAEKLSVIRTDRHENLVSPKNILPVRKKSPQKFTVTCIMFSLAFLE
jgi:hypothetical protein